MFRGYQGIGGCAKVNYTWIPGHIDVHYSPVPIYDPPNADLRKENYTFDDFKRCKEYSLFEEEAKLHNIEIFMPGYMDKNPLTICGIKVYKNETNVCRVDFS